MPLLRSALTAALLFAAATAGPCSPTGGDDDDGPDETDTPAAVTPTEPGSTPTSTAAGTAPPLATPPPDDGPFVAVHNGGLKEATNATCSDGVDNDGNGFTDCADRGCEYTQSVTVCGDNTSTEASDAECSNGRDDDGDGYTDCQDYDCYWNGDVGVCDRDGDGANPNGGDCFDHPDFDMAMLVGPGIPEMCGDREDNDCDGIAEEPECLQLHLGIYPVAYVIDGDTIEISGLGRSRLLGVDTPETGYEDPSKTECYGAEARTFTENILENTNIDVWLDPYGYDTDFKDVYGRWLTHIYRDDGVYHNGDLVLGGYGCAITYFDNINNDLMIELQNEAQDSGAGLWSACAPNAEDVCF